MNLSELLNFIGQNPRTIKVEGTGDADRADSVFRRVTYVKDEFSAEQLVINILVKDAGQTGEQAWIKGVVPDYLRSSQFRDELITKIESEKANIAGLEAYEITRVDEVNQIAEVNAYIYDNVDGCKMQKFVLFKDNGVFKIRKLT